MAARQLIIVGAGGHAVSVFDVATAAGFSVTCFVDPQRGSAKLLDIAVVNDLSQAGVAASSSIAIAIGDNARRADLHDELSRRYSSAVFPVLVHPASVVSALSSLGEGSIVMPGAVIGPRTRIGRFCILNTRASIDHDCVMDDFSSLAPGATTGGGVRIGTRTAISIGAVIRHNVGIGDDSVLGASSYLDADLSSNQVAYGIPARSVRIRSRGDPYL